MIFQDESGDIVTEPSYLCDAELDDETIGKKRYLHHCSFRSEKNQRTRRQAYHSYEESLLSAQFLFRTRKNGETLTRASFVSKNENQVAKWKTKESGSLLEGQKEQILSEVRTEIQKHEFQADSDTRSIQELNGIIESQRREIDHTIAGD